MSYLNPGRLGLIGAPTYPMLRDATMTTLLEILDRNGVLFEHSKAENILVMKDTGSKILCRAVDEFERLRGTNLAWFGLDELTYTPESSWLRLEGRLRDPKAQRLCGFAVWTPKGFDWVFRRFIKEKVDGYEAIQAEPFENHFLLSKVPDFYRRLEQSYDERFYQQEALGAYVNSNGGLVYHAFKREDNVKDLELDPRLPVLWALDFNVDPMSSVIVQMEGSEIRVLDEIVLRRASTWDACEEFRNRFPSPGQEIVIYGDATGNKLQTAGTTDYRILQKFFAEARYKRVHHKVEKSNPPVRERVALVNARLRDASGETSLFVSPNCKELIKDFEEVSYKTDSAVIDKEADPRRTHLSDALGYLLWQECERHTTYGHKNQRLICT